MLYLAKNWDLLEIASSASIENEGLVVYKLKYLLSLVPCLMKYETPEIVSNPAVLLSAHATGVAQGSAMAPLLHMLIIIGTLAFSPCCTSIAGNVYIRTMDPSPSTVLENGTMTIV